MDSSHQHAVVTKRRLGNATMYVNHLAKAYWEKHTSFTWHVVGFFTLIDNADYECNIKVIGWKLNLNKTKYTVTVTVDTTEYGGCKNLSCCVCYDKNNTSSYFVAHRVSESLFKTVLSSRVVKAARNSVLNCCSCLKLHFKTDVKTTETFYPNRYMRDLHGFIKFNWNFGFISIQFVDFILYSSGFLEMTKYRSNKAFLAARSVFFRNLFKESRCESNEMAIYDPKNVLCVLLYYLYTCKFFPKGLQEIMDSIKLTWDLDIPSLKAKCIDLISDIMNEFNVHKIREGGVERGLTFLSEKADVFIASMSKTTSQRTGDSR